jgi:FtsP/CotA-like multicopper oxidase with cupredoxin domain
MTIVAADSEPVVPYEVDEVILHSAERFDVEIDIPLDMANTTVWIRADTLESIEQGYQVRDLDLKHQMRQ